MALKHPATTYMGMINFLNDFLCGGMCLLGAAPAVAFLGPVWYVAAVVLECFLAHFSIMFLVETAEMSQRFTTHSLSAHYLGDTGSAITRFMITIGNWFFLVNVFQIIADFIPSFIGDWTVVDDSSFLTSRYFAVSVGALLV